MPPPRPLSIFCYLCACSAALFFSYLNIVDPAGVASLLWEDGWVENLTAISLFLAGLLLFATAWMERSFSRRCIYILGGLAMGFGAGEEIDWGQRIFMFMMDPPKAASIHNVHHVWLFDRFLPLAPLLLCTVTLAAFFCGKDRLFGIPLPSILLVLCLLLMLSYRENVDPHGTNPIAYHMSLPSRTENALLLVLLSFTLFRRKAVFFIPTLAVLAFFHAHEYMNSSSDVYPAALMVEESGEFLFGLFCAFYAAELFERSRIMDGAPRRPGTPFHSGEQSGGWIAFASSLPVNVRSSMVNGISALVIAGSIGLAVLGYFNPETTSAFVEKGYSRIRDAEPIVRAEFDVYLVENQLIYFKTPCAPADKRETFFLHVFPTDVNVLPRGRRRKRGFDHRDYWISVWLDVTHAGGRCMAVVPLPDYGVAGIRTGQYTRNGPSWTETFRFIE